MPILTLTTDIGQRDFLVGAMKGQFLQLDPTLNICDITHYLPQTNFPQSAYICANAFKHFPAGTFHLVIANLYESSLRYLLMARHKQQYIICADNGLLTMVTGERPQEIVAIPLPDAHNLLQVTALVARVVNTVSKTGQLSNAGQSIEQIVEKYPLRPTVGPDWIEGQILFIDQFENVVINITETEFNEQRRNRRFKIVFKRNEVIESISPNYAAVPETEKLAWFNSAGYLEIALRHGNMAGLFGLQGFNEQQQRATGSDTSWFYQTVRVFFEE
jgi:S-adenosylmethionine hydrolase